MSDAMPPLDLEIVSVAAPYKSINNLRWKGIPGFSILTGRNGSGKTQLLELIAHHISGARLNATHETTVRLNGGGWGRPYGAHQVGYVPSSGLFSGGSGASLARMQSIRHSEGNSTADIGAELYDANAMAARSRRGIALSAVKENIRLGQGNSVFLDRMIRNMMSVDVTEGLESLFLIYRLNRMQAMEDGVEGLGRDGSPLGPEPWKVVNETLSKAGFPYEVEDPLKFHILDEYKMVLVNRVNGTRIFTRDLSSGERTILQLNLWLFSSSWGVAFPKLLLLDEPDAHLHPSMTAQFLDVVYDVLVKKYGVRVIMTTHSPSTVALAPEGSVFQLERGAVEVQRVDDRASIVSTLTAGLITVSRATRFCFVEDEVDVSFYTAVFDILTDVGPSKDPHAIRDAPSIVFIAASVGRGSGKTPGGKGNVKKWINKLDSPPLSSTFFGVVDRDDGDLNCVDPRIKVIGRYSFENYILDPLNVFGLLIEDGSSPEVDGVKINSGDEHLIRLLPEGDLQKIVNKITSMVECHKSDLKAEPRIDVNYTRGKKVSVPFWVINHRGHDLLPIYQKIFGSPGLVNPLRLVKSLRRVRLIPLELAHLYADLQSN